MIAVADTSPLNYLIQIDAIDLLPILFEQVLIPPLSCGNSNIPKHRRSCANGFRIHPPGFLSAPMARHQSRLCYDWTWVNAKQSN